MKETIKKSFLFIKKNNLKLKTIRHKSANVKKAFDKFR